MAIITISYMTYEVFLSESFGIKRASFASPFPLKHYLAGSSMSTSTTDMKMTIL